MNRPLDLNEGKTPFLLCLELVEFDKKTVAVCIVIAAIIVASVFVFALVTLFANNSGNVGVSISFTCDATSYAYPITYQINWGDGTVTSGSVDSESFTTSHVYSTAGSYLPFCSATDADGDFLGDGSTQVNVGTTSTIQYTAPSSTTTQNSATQTTSAAQSTTVTVTQSAFSVTATPYPGTGTAPLNVEFGTSSTPGSSYTCSWTFGDGSSASGCTVQHTYTAVGTYVAQLTATSTTSDQISVSSATVSVIAPTTTTSTTTTSSTIPLSVSIVASPPSGNVPLSTTFTSSVSGGTAPYTYSWSFGDSSTSALADPAHTYQNPGTFLAQVTVTSSAGGTGFASLILVAASSSSTSSAISYTTTTQVTTETSTVTSGSSTFVTTYTTQQCLILSSVPQCHLPNTPPGLSIGWATSNMSIGATAVPEPIGLSSSLSVANIESSNTISNIAFDSNTMQIELTTSEPVSISMQVPQKPSSVWADSTEISTWTYTNGVLTINADTSAVTIFFQSSNGIVTFLEANWILILIIVAVAAGIIGASMRRR